MLLKGRLAASLLCIAAFSGFCTRTRAHAETLSFSNLSGGIDNGTFTRYPSPQAVDGYRLNENENGFLSIDPTGSDGFYNHTGSRTISAYDSAPFTLVTAANGGVFSLTSLDATNAYLQDFVSGGATVVFTGIVATGGAVSKIVTLPSNNAFEDIKFSGFTDLTDLVIDDSGNATQFGQYDNLVVTTQTQTLQPTPAAASTPLPQPALSGIALFGLMGLSGLRRRAMA